MNKEAYREADNARDLLIADGLQLLQALSTGEVPNLQTQQETVSSTAGDSGATEPYMLLQSQPLTCHTFEEASELNCTYRCFISADVLVGCALQLLDNVD